MKKIKQLPMELMERLELPEEIVPGSVRLSVNGGRTALVEGHRGILEYSQERVVLALPRGKLSLSGAGMLLRAMNGGELLVSGRIESVEWS